MEKSYAIVTGAGQGLGRAIALDLAGRGYGIIAVARSVDKLIEVTQACAALNNGRAIHIEQDLVSPNAAAELVDKIQATGYPLSILVNNAGEAIWGKFADKPLSDHTRMMRLNMTVPVELTHLLIPDLQKADQAYILNVGSMVAYNSYATLGTYSGSKSFILRWSRSIRMELGPLGIKVCCVCPGSVITGFTERAGMQALDALAKQFGHPPGPVAKAAVKAMFAGKAEVVPGLMNKITVKAMGLFPEGLVERVASSIYLKKLG